MDAANELGLYLPIMLEKVRDVCAFSDGSNRLPPLVSGAWHKHKRAGSANGETAWLSEMCPHLRAENPKMETSV